MLISASADGTVCVWDPSANLPNGPEKEIKAKISFKAHPDGVLAMALFQPPIDTPDAQPVHLCISGAVLQMLLHICLLAAGMPHAPCAFRPAAPSVAAASPLPT